MAAAFTLTMFEELSTLQKTVVLIGLRNYQSELDSGPASRDIFATELREIQKLIIDLEHEEK